MKYNEKVVITWFDPNILTLTEVGRKLLKKEASNHLFAHWAIRNRMDAILYRYMDSRKNRHFSFLEDLGNI